MYWIYLFIFILIVLTPKFISGSFLVLHEEDIEALLIFCFGALGFMLYLAKEKALLKVFREKIHLQKQANMITRDLSDSYSYIGEMNRKLDIVKELIFRLPQTTARVFRKGKTGDVYSPLLETVSQLSKTDQVALCFVDTRKKEMKKMVERIPKSIPTAILSPEQLLLTEKFFWEEEGNIIVRSPKQAGGIAAFLIFSKTQNHVEDGEVFKILVSEALLLYCVEQGVVEREEQ